MARKLTWFPWDVVRVETDEDWRLMSDEERGLFMRLLNHSWLNNGLPTNEDDLADVIGKPLAHPKWSKRVCKKFTLAGGRLINVTQEEFRTRANSKSEKATKSVRTRYERKENEEIRAYDSVSISSSSSEVLNTSSQVEDFSTRADVEIPLPVAPVIPSVDSPQMIWQPPKSGIAPPDPLAEERLTWAEEIYFRHPKQANKHASILALCRLYDVPKDRALFEGHYDAWIECWAREGAKFTPPLVKPDGSGFLPDGAWRKPPPRPPKVEEKLSESLRALRGVKV